METIHQSVQVSFRYPVHFTVDLFSTDNPILKDLICSQGIHGPKKMLTVVDAGVIQHHPDLLARIDSYCRHYAQHLALVSPPLVVEGGEQVKNDPSCAALVQRAIHEYGIDRHSYVMVIGGGAVIDMVGYAAATAHRGVRLVRVPTTVLSQNDSGVGVKNSVNAFGKKNFLGTFAPPCAVLNDFDLLRALPDREWRSGISEAIKVALLKDANFFGFIEREADKLATRDMEAMQRLIYRCAQLHLEHIATSGDPFEFGSSRPLDFGHWAAHKLEQLSNYSLRHGEAVAIGIALDSTYSYLSGLLSEESLRRILDVILAVGLPIYASELTQHDRWDAHCVLQGLSEFREHLGGRLTIMLLEDIGQGIEVHEMNEEKIVQSIALLKHHQATQLHGEYQCEPIPALAL